DVRGGGPYLVRRCASGLRGSRVRHGRRRASPDAVREDSEGRPSRAGCRAGKIGNAIGIDMSYDFSGQVAVVTGAGRGIGRAVAERFLTGGATVVAVDIDERALSSIGAGTPAGERVLGCVADVGDSAQVDDLLETIDAELGRLDVMVNNAGIIVFKE